MQTMKNITIGLCSPANQSECLPDVHQKPDRNHRAQDSCLFLGVHQANTWIGLPDSQSDGCVRHALHRLLGTKGAGLGLLLGCADVGAEKRLKYAIRQVVSVERSDLDAHMHSLMGVFAGALCIIGTWRK